MIRVSGGKRAALEGLSIRAAVEVLDELGSGEDPIKVYASSFPNLEDQYLPTDAEMVRNWLEDIHSVSGLSYIGIDSEYAHECRVGYFGLSGFRVGTLRGMVRDRLFDPSIAQSTRAGAWGLFAEVEIVP
ncbi:MAG: hypothetical protein CMJ75_18885 [Planctomycetaceae bacterium]|nr:hypothetical protein [Planctomycetaceae bacterium]